MIVGVRRGLATSEVTFNIGNISVNDGFLYFYAAEVVRVYDGDSIRFDIDLGFDQYLIGLFIDLWKLRI